MSRRAHDTARQPGSVRRAQMVEAAMRIIATRGARRFTAQLLAREVGITPGALYRHFENMEAVVGGVVERMGTLLFEGFPPENADPIERLGLFFRHRTRTLIAHPHLGRLLHSDHLAQAASRAQAARIDGFKQRSQRFVLDCLRRARQQGALGPGVSPEAGAVIVLGSILRLSHVGAADADGAAARRLPADVWSAIERALRAPRVSYPRRTA